jgi:hypothetical protein
MAGSGSSPAILFEDIFSVQILNPEEKRFDRVDRIVCAGETYETVLKLDYACEMISFKPGDKFTLAIASTLNKNGEPDSDYYDPDGKVRFRSLVGGAVRSWYTGFDCAAKSYGRLRLLHVWKDFQIRVH